MKKTILEIYALAICFFTVACFVITLGLAIWNVIELTTPEFTVDNYQHKCHQSDEAYKKCFSTQHQSIKEDNPEKFTIGFEPTQKRLTEYEQILESEKRQAQQGIVQKLIILFINLLVFFSHWTLAKRARETPTV